MKTTILPIALFAMLAAASCKTDPEKTDSYVHSKIDSLVGVRMEEVNRHSMEDLDQRMTIEVKAKADSIVAARRAHNAKRDSASAAAMGRAQSANAPVPR